MIDIKIYFIRHGSTVAIEKNLYSGSSDIELSKIGKKQTVKLKKSGIYPDNIDLFYSSELSRCTDTLKLIYEDVTCQTIKELNEQNLGNLDMKSFEGIKTSKLYYNWLTDNTGDIPCPNGESLNQFKMRIKLGYHFLLGYIKKENAEKEINKVVVVTHGSVISILMGLLFPGLKNRKGWIPEPSRGYIIEYKNGNIDNYTEL